MTLQVCIIHVKHTQLGHFQACAFRKGKGHWSPLVFSLPVCQINADLLFLPLFLSLSCTHRHTIACGDGAYLKDISQPYA